MLTISKPLAAGQAQSYHQKEFTAKEQNYWSQRGIVTGEWQGRLAVQFGLAGTVSANDFAKLSQGQHPQTGEQLVRQRASYEYQDADGKTIKTMEHRAGWDATFSAPKSVSLTALVGGDERVREAHRESVRVALDQLERYTQARIGGNHPPEKIVRQKDPALKSAVELLATGQVSAALDALQQQGRVKEIPNREERVRAIAKSYVESPENTLVVSPDNAYCLFGLLCVSGLRLGEAQNLELQDVDLQAAVLTIRGAKFGKTRLVPLHASTCTVLDNYIARRQRHWAGQAVSSYLFVSSTGNRLGAVEIYQTFHALSRQIGLRDPSNSRSPRLHDMRHRFATNTLVQWYRSGQDPERRLPLLSTYLGHVRVADTQWYLEGSPELMREAMQRLQQRWEGRS
jgi:integrase